MLFRSFSVDVNLHFHPEIATNDQPGEWSDSSESDQLHSQLCGFKLSHCQSFQRKRHSACKYYARSSPNTFVRRTSGRSSGPSTWQKMASSCDLANELLLNNQWLTRSRLGANFTEAQACRTARCRALREVPVIRGSLPVCPLSGGKPLGHHLSQMPTTHLQPDSSLVNRRRIARK